MKRHTIAAWTLLAAVAAVLGLPLTIGVWLPDIFLAAPRTLASAALADGSELRVVQYWNHVDFYTTELWHTTPAGQRDIQVLDGDHCKSWFIPMSVDVHHRIVSVTLCDGREKTIPCRSTPTA